MITYPQQLISDFSISLLIIQLFVLFLFLFFLFLYISPCPPFCLCIYLLCYFFLITGLLKVGPILHKIAYLHVVFFILHLTSHPLPSWAHINSPVLFRTSRFSLLIYIFFCLVSVYIFIICFVFSLYL